MSISAAGLDFIRSYETLQLKPYNDGYGNWTIGYGHKITAEEAAAMSEGIDQATADAMLAEDIAWIEAGVNNNFDGELTQNEFDALVSLGFNIGRSALVNSDIFDYAEVTDPSYFTKPYDKKAYEAAVLQKFRQYINSGETYSLGLDRRRVDEAEMFLYGDYSRDNDLTCDPL